MSTIVPTNFDSTRRDLLCRMTTGLTGIALSQLLFGEMASAASSPMQPHFEPKAKQFLQIFCPGAASHIDLWDHKPMLEKFYDTPLPGGEAEVSFQGKNGNLMKSPWPFAPAGQCGKMISTMLPHMTSRPGNDELRARMTAYELAAKMQLTAPEVSDFSAEPQYVHDLYGTGDRHKLKAAYAKNCLLARRFLEQGVRYVSLYCASRASAVDGLLNWDAHKTLKADYERHCPIFDQPTAALLSDMKQPGMLNDVLVVWCTEFGRMPTLIETARGEFRAVWDSGDEKRHQRSIRFGKLTLK